MHQAHIYIMQTQLSGFSGEESDTEVQNDALTGDFQVMILQQLKKLNSQPDRVEEQGAGGCTTNRKQDNPKLSLMVKPKLGKICKQSYLVTSS